MKALILTCNTGQGHNSCASGIKEVFDDHGDECHIEDALSFISPSFSCFIANWHVRIYRYMPWLFSFGYSYAEKHPKLFEKNSIAYSIMSKGAESLKNYVESGKYDTIICTHVFSALILSDMMERYGCPVKTCFVATDYTCSPSARVSKLDRCFIPDDSLYTEFECENIPTNNIVCSGIPIRQIFFRRTDKETAKLLVGISPDSRHLLIMCGSMGCGPIKKITNILAGKMGDGKDLTVICGTNKKLQQKLEKRFANYSNIHIKGYVKDVSLLMDSADVYLTKPGGISVTEAAIKRLPMVFINAVAGCEEYNRSYFVEIDAAVAGDDSESLAALCLQLLDNDAQRLSMEKALENNFSYNAAELIYREMLRLDREAKKYEIASA